MALALVGAFITKFLALALSLVLNTDSLKTLLCESQYSLLLIESRLSVSYSRLSSFTLWNVYRLMTN